MKRFDRRVTELEQKMHSSNIKSVLVLRLGETTEKGIARYKTEGKVLAENHIIGDEPMTEEQWIAAIEAGCYSHRSKSDDPFDYSIKPEALAKYRELTC